MLYYMGLILTRAHQDYLPKKPKKIDSWKTSGVNPEIHPGVRMTVKPERILGLP